MKNHLACLSNKPESSCYGYRSNRHDNSSGCRFPLAAFLRGRSLVDSMLGHIGWPKTLFIRLSNIVSSSSFESTLVFRMSRFDRKDGQKARKRVRLEVLLVFAGVVASLLVELFAFDALTLCMCLQSLQSRFILRFQIIVVVVVVLLWLLVLRWKRRQRLRFGSLDNPTRGSCFAFVVVGAAAVARAERHCFLSRAIVSHDVERQDKDGSTPNASDHHCEAFVLIGVVVLQKRQFSLRKGLKYAERSLYSEYGRN